MLKHVKLTNVGPAPKLEFELSPRLNLITGDNGLGKSFLLDVAWWALTEKWPSQVNPRMVIGRKALPSGKGDAEIECSAKTSEGELAIKAQFVRQQQIWERTSERRMRVNLVLYAMPDGSFAVYDPWRNFFQTMSPEDGVLVRPPAFVFTPPEVWDGLSSFTDPRISYCNGLIRDWASWQKENGEAFTYLKAVLRKLSPLRGDILVPGELTRVSLDDVRDIPTIIMGDGQEVPVVHASSGIRRILAIAYLLVWTWQEHCKASKLLGMDTINQMVLLLDEVEAHLHPSWQRSIVDALLTVIHELSADIDVQILATTHSPLVMASVEPLFDAAKDAWFDLDLEQTAGKLKTVVLSHRPFVRHGEASNWLTSEAFDLTSSRSIEAERILEKASLAMSDPNFGKSEAGLIDQELQSVLGDTDPFWVRWRYVAEKKGWL